MYLNIVFEYFFLCFNCFSVSLKLCGYIKSLAIVVAEKRDRVKELEKQIADKQREMEEKFQDKDEIIEKLQNEVRNVFLKVPKSSIEAVLVKILGFVTRNLKKYFEREKLLKV